MPVHNEDIAAAFDEIADLLALEEANPFRVRAYRTAARNIRGLDRELAQSVAADEDLTKLPGIGKDLAARIKEIVRTGHAATLDQLHKEVPAGLEALLKIPGLGPKRVKALYDTLHIKTPKQLEQAARSGRLQQLPGFGAKTAQRILQTIAAHRGEEKRFLHRTASQFAEPLVEYLKSAPGVSEVVVAGSYRRGLDTVGDLDILATANNTDAVMQHFVDYEDVHDVVSKGSTRSTVYLRNGLQVDLRVVEKKAFGAALQYFTGSKAHNIALRRLGQKRGLKINEYGVFKGEKRIAGETEASVFKSVGLPWIPPELREERGEIEAARAGKLPKLVELKDLRGDLHVHTKATDGHNSLREMAEAARERNLEYLAITEHSRRLTVAHGLDVKRLRRQMEDIDALNASLRGITILKGIEVDILEDGALDLPNDVLGELDLVIGAVHSQFKLTRAKQTRRILKAMDHPHFTILAHPSGRLIDQREPYDVDMLKVIRHARARGCYLELNAHPERLDLLDTHCQLAKEEGVRVAISSDAHSVQDYGNLRYGVGQARRGWLARDDVLNTRPLKELRALLKKTM